MSKVFLSFFLLLFLLSFLYKFIFLKSFKWQIIIIIFEGLEVSPFDILNLLGKEILFFLSSLSISLSALETFCEKQIILHHKKIYLFNFFYYYWVISDFFSTGLGWGQLPKILDLNSLDFLDFFLEFELHEILEFF